MSDQTIEQRLDEILEAVHTRGYYQKTDELKGKGANVKTSTLMYESKQALLQLLKETRKEAYKHGLMTGSLPAALGKPIAKDYLAKLTPKENK